MRKNRKLEHVFRFEHERTAFLKKNTHRKEGHVFRFEHERKAGKIDDLTEKSGFLVRFLIFSRFLFALCIINYVYPYCC